MPFLHSCQLATNQAFEAEDHPLQQVISIGRARDKGAPAAQAMDQAGHARWQGRALHLQVTAQMIAGLYAEKGICFNGQKRVVYERAA